METAAVVGDELAPAVVADAAAGDVAALARIVARYHDDMARVCVVVCGGDADAAEDAVQSAWPVAWRKLGSLRDGTRLRPWLISLAANQARQQQRRERRRRVLEIAVAPLAHGDAGDPSARVDLSLALRRLGPDDRALLAMRYVADLESTEIGRALGISASGVRSRLERLLARLRTELSDG
jgi:RNA polymerase sigma-70 factor (ECF subfamily)